MHFVSEESGWSSIQTVAIPANQTLPTASPSREALPTHNSGSQTPLNLGLTFGQALIVAVLGAIFVLLVILIAVYRKNRLATGAIANKFYNS